MRTAVALAAAANGAFVPTTTTVTKWVVNQTCNGSTLYVAQLANETAYEFPPQVIDLHGSRWQQGYDYAIILHKQAAAVWQAVTGNELSKLELVVVQAVLDHMWDTEIVPHLDDQIKEELAGVDQASVDVGAPEFGRLLRRGVGLSNFNGPPVGDIIWTIIHDLLQRSGDDPEVARAAPPSLPPAERAAALVAVWEALMARKTWVLNMGCSQFALWGGNTKEGKLLQGRNWDWAFNTGADRYKLVTVWHPPEQGAQAYFIAGMAGLYGGIHGMNGAGVSITESTDDSKDMTAKKMPWTLHLRQVLETATTTCDAAKKWIATNSSSGNNLIISAPKMVNGGEAEAAACAKALGVERLSRALVLETEAGHTAVLSDQDPREAAATVKDPATGRVVPIGRPIKEGVFRTNHAFDPYFRQHAMYPNTLSSNVKEAHAADTQLRYEVLSDAIANGTARGPLDIPEAITVAAHTGDKCHANSSFATVCPYDSLLECSGNTGSNILSLVFAPEDLDVWMAFERGLGEARTPAGCNPYVQLGLKRFLQGETSVVV